jgi:hypothetical protein
MMDRLGSTGRILFAVAIVSLGVETLVCAQDASRPLVDVLQIIPWVSTVPQLAYFAGAVLVCCGVALLFSRTMRPSAVALGSLLCLCAVLTQIPRSAADPANISFRTTVFEPLAIGSLAWLLIEPGAMSARVERPIRWLLAVSLMVFGADHFIAVNTIAARLIPNWIPWHVFWTVFFGISFIAAGVSIGLRVMERWGAACLGLMFAIWVVTLHLPLALGLYDFVNSPRPNQWSSLFIAIALWGGSWALASRAESPASRTKQTDSFSGGSARSAPG